MNVNFLRTKSPSIPTVPMVGSTCNIQTLDIPIDSQPYPGNTAIAINWRQPQIHPESSRSLVSSSGDQTQAPANPSLNAFLVATGVTAVPIPLVP
ncbi:hypothetical protein J1614_009333 [Plenodomus biglobosus]|nr:hypothetical protein J1614_009333 [Plenodomus biglobosus]